jgi:hypothetical protein
MTEALQVLAEARNSTRLREFLRSGVDRESIGIHLILFGASFPRSGRSGEHHITELAARSQPTGQYLLSEFVASGVI